MLGGLLGGATSIPLMALLFFGEQFAGLPFIPFDLFDWLARALPGNVITLVIDSLVDLITTFNLGPTDRAAKQIEQFMALAIILVAGILLGATIARIKSHIKRPGWEIVVVAGWILCWRVVSVEAV